MQQKLFLIPNYLDIHVKNALLSQTGTQPTLLVLYKHANSASDTFSNYMN